MVECWTKEFSNQKMYVYTTVTLQIGDHFHSLYSLVVGLCSVRCH